MWWAAAVGVAVLLTGGCAGGAAKTAAAGSAASPSPSVAASCEPSDDPAAEIRDRSSIESEGGTLIISWGDPLCIDGVANASVPVYWTPFTYEMPAKGFSFTGVATVSGKSRILGTYDGVSALQLKFPTFKDKCTGVLVHLTPEADVREVAALSPKAGRYVVSSHQPGSLLAVDSRGSDNCIEITVTHDK